MERENQRVAVTKRMLREGLLRLLEEKPLDKIHITELCKEAGINRITFYRHYETPRDVLLEMEKEVLGELRDSVKLPKSREEIKQYLEYACDFMEKNMELIKVTIQNNTDSEFYSLFDSLFQEFSISSPVMKELDADTLQILSVCSAGSSYFLMRQWMLGNIQKTPKEIAAIFYNQLCNADWVSLSKQLGLM